MHLFRKKQPPKQGIRLIRAMTEDGWRPVTMGTPIEHAPRALCLLIERCCNQDSSLRPCFEDILLELVSGSFKEEVEREVYTRNVPISHHSADASGIEISTGINPMISANEGGFKHQMNKSAAFVMGNNKAAKGPMASGWFNPLARLSVDMDFFVSSIGENDGNSIHEDGVANESEVGLRSSNNARGSLQESTQERQRKSWARTSQLIDGSAVSKFQVMKKLDQINDERFLTSAAQATRSSSPASSPPAIA